MKFLKVSLVFLLVAVIGFSVWVVSILRDVDSVLQAYKHKAFEVREVAWRLEEGSKLSYEEFSFFSKFVGLNEKVSEKLEEREEKKYFIVREDATFEYEIGNNCMRHRCYQSRVGSEKIPPSVWMGLLGVEDVRFLQHRGVDYYAIARAIIADIKALSFVQGGSTLTQQLAKNLFLSSEKTLKRKFKEAIYSFYIESQLSKEEILNLYLNEVYWGQVSGIQIKGVRAAARIYFKKQLNELTPYEGAILISMLKGPAVYNPAKGVERLRARTNVVYKSLQELNLAPDSSELVWNSDQWLAWSKEFRSHAENFYYLAILNSLEKKNWDVSANVLDRYEQFVLQVHANKILQAAKEKSGQEDIAVKVLITPYNCSDTSCKEPYQYYSKSERNLEVAISEERHQVGSIIKPLIYHEFRQLGLSWDAMYSTAPLVLNLKSGEWKPTESSRVAVKELSAREALQKSRNRPLIRIAQELGFEELENKLSRKFQNLLSPLSEYPSQLLGAVELSLLEVTKLYKDFERFECEDIKEGKESVIEQLWNANLTTISKIARPFMKELVLFGKTGTTNYGRDNWFVSIDGFNVYVIWLGAESLDQEKSLGLYGSTTAYKIFETFLDRRGKRLNDYVCL